MTSPNDNPNPKPKPKPKLRADQESSGENLTELQDKGKRGNCEAQPMCFGMKDKKVNNGLSLRVQFFDWIQNDFKTKGENPDGKGGNAQKMKNQLYNKDSLSTIERLNYSRSENIRAGQEKYRIKNGLKAGDFAYNQELYKKDVYLTMEQKVKSVKEGEKWQRITLEQYSYQSLEQRLKSEKIPEIGSACNSTNGLSELKLLQKNQTNHGDIEFNNVAQGKNLDAKDVQSSQNRDQDNECFQKAEKKIKKNRGQNTQDCKQITKQAILQEHDEQSRQQLAQLSVSALGNVGSAVVDDICYNGLTKNTLKTGGKQLLKGGIVVGVKALEQNYKKSKILENVDNHNCKLGLGEEMGFMAISEVGIEVVNLATGEEKITSQKLIQSSKNVSVNLSRQFTRKAVTKAIEIKERENKGDNKSYASANVAGAVAGLAIGTAFDAASGKDVKESLIDNGKQAAGEIFRNIFGVLIGAIFKIWW